MALYHLYSHNVEIKYKSFLLSKASLFTFASTVMTIVLPFIVAHKSRGFWITPYSFYEKPAVQSTFNYLLVAYSEDPSDVIICGDIVNMFSLKNNLVENCAEIQIQENKSYGYEKTDMLHLSTKLNIQPEFKMNSILIIIELDYRLETICKMHMQTLAIIDKEFTSPPSELHHYGDLEIYQTSHLPCPDSAVDIRYNTSLLHWSTKDPKNIEELILENYHDREVTTIVKTLFSRKQYGYTGNLNINVHLRLPKAHMFYQPSILQLLMWTWPQYLSFVAVFYWIFNHLKKYVFNRRLVMAWEIIPWKSN